MKGSDYTAIRVLPYVVALVIIIAHAVAIALSILAIKVSMYSGESSYKFLGTLVSYVNSVKHIAMICMFICLYRLSEVTKGFYYAWLISLVYMVNGLLTQVFSWIADVIKDSIAANSAALVVSLLPDISAMFVIYSLLKGESEVYHNMGEEEKGKSVRRLVYYLHPCKKGISV